MKVIRRFREARRLFKVMVLYDGSGNWTLQWKGGVKVYRGDIEGFAKLLMSIKAKEGKTLPPSKRTYTYLKIAQEVTEGLGTTIWVWEKDLKKLK